MWKKKADKTREVTPGGALVPTKETPPPEQVFAEDETKKLDPYELERFCRLEAEIRGCMQGMRIVDLELLEIKRTLEAKVSEVHQRKAALKTELNVKWKLQYDSLCTSLAQKYGISKPAHLLIDTDAGTIRDSQES